MLVGKRPSGRHGEGRRCRYFTGQPANSFTIFDGIDGPASTQIPIPFSQEVAAMTHRLACTVLPLSLVAVLAAVGLAQVPVQVTVTDARAEHSADVYLPVDPTPRIVVGNFGQPMRFGLTVEGKRITCSP